MVDLNETHARLQRLINDDPFQPARDPSHETLPDRPVPSRTGAEQIADKAIGVLDQTIQHAIEKIPPLRERLDRLEQMLIAVGVDSREVIRATTNTVAVCLKIIEQIDQQITEAERPLADLSGSRQDSTEAHAIDRTR